MEIIPSLILRDHFVDGAPVGEAAYVTVVDKEIDLELTGEMLVVAGFLLGIVAVDGPELHASLPAPLHRLIEQLALTDTPEDELVVIADEHLQRLNSERTLLANLGITVLDNRPVEINCDGHSE